MRGTETVTRLRASGVAGRHGERAPETETELTGCIFIPRTSSEQTDRADTVVVGYTLICPAGTDLLATDRVRARGAVWEVVGEPGDYRTARGRAKAVIAAVQRVEG